MPVAIGVDVGGTKTHLRVETHHQLTQDVVMPTASWWRPGTPIEDEANAERLVSLMGTPAAGPLAVVVGAHGVDSRRVAITMAQRLKALVSGPVEVVNDAALVAPAAGFTGPSVTVVAGTGSIVLAVDESGRTTRHGGHGHLLGDEGSAPALVRDLARAVLRAGDRGEQDTTALAALADAFGIPDHADRADELSIAMHAAPSRTDWGNAAPAVFAAAEAGSPLAARVIETHAEVLAGLVRLHLEAGVLPEAVVLAGGVVSHQPSLVDAITGAIHSTHPEQPVVLLREPPVAGALALARVTLARQLPTASHSARPHTDHPEPGRRHPDRLHTEGNQR